MITQTYILEAGDFALEIAGAVHILESDPRFKNAVFFDIETTGFSAVKNAIYLIGCLWTENGRWRLTQWLAQDKSREEQRAVMDAFFKAIGPFTTLVTYNGTTFDLPFIDKKARALGLEQELSDWEHMDLYKNVRGLKRLLKLDNLKLKTVEAFLGIYREDEYSGGALIPIFETFAKSGNENLKQLLLLHNFEDIKDMLLILPILAYEYFFLEAGFSLCPDFESDTGHVVLHILPDVPLPESLAPIAIPLASNTARTPANDKALDASGSTGIAEVSGTDITAGAFTVPNTHNMAATLTINTDEVRLSLPVWQTELKYFYENYKDYYYLPAEDCAIHKSVAGFVEKEFRQKATKNNCYTKKAGVFLPQKTDCFTPAFKEAYEDTLTWFEYKDDFLKSENINRYIQSFLRFPILGSF